MNGLPPVIFRRWGHSFEEDTGDIAVYRPAEFDFPRARGRAGLEFEPDGKYIEWVIGPADTSLGVNGHWHIVAPGQVQITFKGSERQPRLLEILQCDASVLKMRQRSLL
jgi:hypothetical protein